MSDRKYSQRGYQDSDRDRSSRGRSGPPGPRLERRPGPRGRGLGKPTATVFRCAACGEKQRAVKPVEGESTCWKCGTDLHTCTHCRYFDSSAPGQCRQKDVDYVAAKAKRNHCPAFEAKATQEFDEHQGVDAPSDAKAAFDALFKL
ncbi:MAG: hypothetical protein AAF657_06460 [Acidobacteriota bacterium]